MEQVILETLVKILCALLLMLISVLGTWLTTVIGRREKLRTISAAIGDLQDTAVLTAGELQQLVVEDLKAAATNHKLTPDQIAMLKENVYSMTMEKMAPAVVQLLEAAGVDTVAIIQGATDAWITAIKQEASAA